MDKVHNKRAELYRKKARFGMSDEKSNDEQYGIVRRHPLDHPEEHKRGKHYLKPIDNPTYNKYDQETLAKNRQKLHEY